MTATAEPTKKIKLTQGALAFFKTLVEQKAQEKDVPLADGIDPQVLIELKNKNIIERIGATRGRYGERGTVKLLVEPEAVSDEPATERKKRDPDAPRQPRKARAASSNGFSSNVIQLPKTAIPLDHATVRQYLDAVSGNAQREFEMRKQNGLDDVAVSKAIKGLKGAMLISKMRELESQHEQTFAEFVRGRFPSEYFSILGIPDPGPDTPDEPKQAVPEPPALKAVPAVTRKR